MNKTLASKYLSALKKEKGKHVTSVDLSHSLGFYPDIICRDLSKFEPLLNFDPEFNLKDLIPQLEEYIESLQIEKPKKKAAPIKVKGTTYQQFIFDKMTLPGGLIDRSIELSDQDLKVLKKLLDEEIKKRKNF